ncbi:MAG: Ldh family oxidoreductase [Oscillospiraceae bacterium]
MDENGAPTTDAAKTKTVVPIAGPKGYGLAVMIEAFAALLAGANYGAGIGAPNKGEHENTGFAMILVDVEKIHAGRDLQGQCRCIYPLHQGQPQGRRCAGDPHAR